MGTKQWTTSLGGVLLVAGVLYGAQLINADEATQSTPSFGIACIGQAAPGTAYEYSVITVRDSHTGLPQSLEGPIPIRVVVTSVKAVKDGAELWARVDRLKTDKDQQRDALYGLKLLQSKGRGQFQEITARDGAYDVPDLFLGYPDFVTMPEGQSAVVRNWRGAPVARWTQSVDAKTGKLTVKVDYYEHAREPDVKNGAKILYWVRDREELVETVPMGQEAAPLLQSGVPEPKDAKGWPRYFNVVPMEVGKSDVQIWQPGALFPEKITRMSPLTDVERRLFPGNIFVADLVKVGLAPVEPLWPPQPGPRPPTSVPEPLQPDPPQPPRPQAATQ